MDIDFNGQQLRLLAPEYRALVLECAKEAKTVEAMTPKEKRAYQIMVSDDLGCESDEVSINNEDFIYNCVCAGWVATD